MRENMLRVAHCGLTTFLLGSAAIAGIACIETTSPAAGVFRVVVSTTGAITDLDPDGYVVSMNDGHLRSIGVEAVVRITYVQRGTHVLRLAGLTENCAVVGDNPRSVMMPADRPFNANLRIDFIVHCVPSGELRLTTATTGVDLDDNGYEVVIEGTDVSTSIKVPANGTVTVPRLLPGSHVLRLGDVEPNCTVMTANPPSVSVTAGSATTIALEVKCVALPRLAFVDVVNNNDEIFVIDSRGLNESRLTANARDNRDPAWSPDGSRIAFASNRDGNNFEIYVMNGDGTSPTRLTSIAADDYAPAWSPDGSRIAFVSHRDGVPTIYVMNADGTSSERLTADDAYDAYDPAWSPDGSRIAFWSTRAGKAGIYVMNADGSAVVGVTFETVDDRQPAWSPDGSKLAFTRTTSSGRHGIFAMKADGSEVRRVTAEADDATNPAWSAGGVIAFSLAACDYYYFYYYDCFADIMSVKEDATPYAPLFLTHGRTAASSPAWRP
jgi:hypothetical protein